VRRQEHLSSVYNAIRILQSFSDEEPELGITELSARLGLAKSTVFRLMRTLTETQLVEQVAESRKYRLGINTFVIGSIALRRMEIRVRAFPHLVDLLQRVRRVVRLGVYDGSGGVVYLVKLPEDKATRSLSSVGKRVAAHCTAVGKVLLAYQSPEEQERVLSRPLWACTPKTITDPERLRHQLEQIRRQGYATTYEESTEGLSSVAVPVLSPEGEALAAISLTGSSNQFLANHLHHYLRELDLASRRIAEELAMARE
jgi:IclR family KDG regulon transcriptional repressor